MSKSKKLVVVTAKIKCQVEGCKSTDTLLKRYFDKSYVGPCGDSFCYHGCNSPACKEQEAYLCNKHHKELSK